MANYILVISNSIYWLFVLLFWCHYWVKRREMKKNYIIGSIILLIIVVLFPWFMVYTDSKKQEQANSMIPSIGQKLWTYNMNAHSWYRYKETDSDESKEDIILQVQESIDNTGLTSYHLLTGNAQVPKEPVLIGEGSQEFLVGKKLYSYYPKTFEYYEVLFNGVKFVQRKLSKKEVSKLLKGYEIIDVSTLEKGTYNLKQSKLHNRFVVLNDTGDDFYKYYIVPNDSKKMELGHFSNQFRIKKSDVTIKIQRLEGCSKAYPCYEINVK